MTKPMARPIVELTEAEKEEERQEQKKVGRWAEKCGAGKGGAGVQGGIGKRGRGQSGDGDTPLPAVSPSMQK